MFAARIDRTDTRLSDPDLQIEDQPVKNFSAVAEEDSTLFSGPSPGKVALRGRSGILTRRASEGSSTRSG